MLIATDETLATILTGRNLPFRYNRTSLTGRPPIADSYGGHTGSLPEPFRAQLFYGRPDYVVFSYDTPIAWHDSVTGEWTVPAVRYSVTTTQHQYTVARALGIEWSSWAPGTIAANKGHGKSPYGPRTGGF
jgi:hypothetical protein